jgi:hypothetical protein
MSKALGRIGLLFLLAAMAHPALAQNNGTAEGDDSPLTEEFILISPDWWLPGGDNQGRNDVREATLPSPPTGPATPAPYCGPSSPTCP